MLNRIKSNSIKLVATFLLFLSGICGLIYEVAWSKYLALFIGSTGYSHMIVLATFMGGLALGAFYWGKSADKISNPLKVYGWIEIAIGIFCFSYPYLIGILEKIFITLASSSNALSSQPGSFALKFLLSFISLIIPTFLMGGTLPILMKFLTKKISDSGKIVATLYYINSFGAVIGTGLAGLYLIRIYGLDGTVWIAASLNILIGLFAMLATKLNPLVETKLTAKNSKPTNSKVKQAEPVPRIFSINAIRIAILTAGISGFIALLYELTWIRLLASILGSTTYSFTLMLIAFISGITLGSLIISLVIRKIQNLIGLLGILQLATAISMILMLPLYERLPYFLMKISTLLSNNPDNFQKFLGFEFLFCFSIMLLPTLFSGMSLPLISRIVTVDIGLIGKSVGNVFSINTIGSVIGALITGLLLIPWLGVKQTLEVGVLLNGALGLSILLFHTDFSFRWKIGLTVFFILIAAGYRIQYPKWNENVFISGVFRAINFSSTSTYEEFNKQQNEGQKILWYKEGVNANIAIRESPFGDTVQKSLVINGKADASSIGDLPTQVLLAQIPLMVSQDSGDALVIGLGSGVTCGSALQHPLKSLGVVEIASEVLQCNFFFKKENNNFLADPRVKIHIDDAITYLKTNPKKYDYIISEPSNPWISGIGNLYSLDFFNLCKSRLRPGGVLTQWFHTYDINNEIFRLVLSTLSNAFPFVSIWKASSSDIIVLASADPIHIDFTAMVAKMGRPEIKNEFARININDLPALLSTQNQSARNNIFKYSQGDLNTTKKPLLEFLAPIPLFTHEYVTLLDSLDERFSVQDQNLWFSEYEKLYPLSLQNYLNIARYRNGPQIGDLGFAYTALKKCLSLDSLNEEALAMMANVSRTMGYADPVAIENQLAGLKAQSESYPDDISIQFAYCMALIQKYQT